MKKSLTINWDEWRAEIESFSRARAEDVPFGWLTSQQFGDGMLICEGHARKRLVDLVKSGKAEKKKFKVMVGTTGVRNLWHYRLKKK